METIRLKKETYDQMNDLIREQRKLMEKLDNAKGIIIDTRFFNNEKTIIGENVEEHTEKYFKKHLNKLIKIQDETYEIEGKIDKFKNSIWFKIYRLFNKS